MFVLRSRLKTLTGLPLNPCGPEGLRRRDPRVRAGRAPIVLRRLFSLIAAALLLLSPLARAQEGGPWTAYTSMRDIRDLLVSPDAVWAITTGGVLRFDRQTRSYTRYTRLDGLAGNQISSIAADSRGHLWFGADHQGLSRFRPETASFDAPFLEFQDLDIKALTANGDRIFVGTDRGISVFLTDKDEVKENYRQLGKLPKDTEVNALAVFDDRLWAGTSGGLAWAALSSPNLQDPDSWTSSGIGSVKDFLIAADTLYCSTVHGVWRIAAGSDRATLEYAATNIVDLDLFQNRVTAASANGILAQRRAPHEWDADSTTAVGVRAIAQVDTMLWMATDSGLAVIGGDSPPPTRDPAANYFYEMAMTDAGELWIATVPKDNITPHGVYQFDGVAWTVHDRNRGLPSDFVATVEIDAAGQVWAGTWGKGVAVRDSAGTWHVLNQINSVLRGCCGNPGFVPIGDIARDADGLMWVANVQVGLAVMDGFPPERGFLYEQSGLKIQEDMDNIAIGPDGLKWISTATEGFILFDDGGAPFTGDSEYIQVFNTFSESRLTSNRVIDILADRSGRLWVATDNGLNMMRGAYARTSHSFRIDEWRVFNTANGLPANSVTALEEDSRGNIWVGTEAGLAQISSAGQVTFTLTVANSGLIDNRVNSLYFDARGGVLWIGTLDGLSRLRVERGADPDPSGPAVYPNPFIMGRRSTELTFSGLPLGASLDIFAPDGRLVRHIEGTPGQATVLWNGQNDAGYLVASGVYFFVASDAAGNTIRGKFAVISAL